MPKFTKTSNTKKCKNQDCKNLIKDQYTICYDCNKTDPYRGWRGVYTSEVRKRIH